MPYQNKSPHRMKLFIYDHCPYCVKARMIFGLKKTPVKLLTLPNDDEKTPISFIGQKMLPILEYSPRQYMPESMDIIHYIDQKFPPVLLTTKKEEEVSLLHLLESIKHSSYSLMMPRWHKSDMEEFKTPSSRRYFQNKKEKITGSFEQALKNTSLFKKEVEQKLLALSPQIKGPWYAGENLSWNDFHLFAFLRGLSVVKDLKIPQALCHYRDQVSKRCKVPLSQAL